MLVLKCHQTLLNLEASLRGINAGSNCSHTLSNIYRHWTPLTFWVEKLYRTSRWVTKKPRLFPILKSVFKVSCRLGFYVTHLTRSYWTLCLHRYQDRRGVCFRIRPSFSSFSSVLLRIRKGSLLWQFMLFSKTTSWAYPLMEFSLMGKADMAGRRIQSNKYSAAWRLKGILRDHSM